MSYPSANHQRATPSLAAKIRDSLLVSENTIVEVVNEVVAAMPAHRAELLRRHLKGSADLGVAVKRVAVDVGVVLTLAKCFASDDDFNDSCGLMHDIDFAGHGGVVGQFARAMVEHDLNSLLKAEGEGASINELIPLAVLERRIRLVLAFMEQMSSIEAH